jgi:aminoglycoside 6'-N-acetyltransferase
MVELILRKGPLAIRRLAEGDSEILSRWLSNPQVLQFYGGRDQPYDLERVQLKFYKEDGISRCIVEWEGVPIGYVQFYPVGPEDKREYGHIATEGLWGMDQFIGESNYWNKGIGSKLVHEVAEYLLSRGARVVVTDPQTWNIRAIRSYEKAGFVRVSLLPEHEWHEGERRDSWLMEYKHPDHLPESED